MAISVQITGSTAMVINTDVTLSAAITAAGVYQLHFDSNPLATFDEILILIVSQKVLTGSTERQNDRIVVARGTDDDKVKVDIPRTSEFSITYKLRQEGGTARTIDWRVDKLQ